MSGARGRRAATHVSYPGLMYAWRLRAWFWPGLLTPERWTERYGGYRRPQPGL